MDSFEVYLVAILFLFLGSCAGDRATFQDCAITGRAEMVSGGHITCEIVKEKK